MGSLSSPLGQVRLAAGWAERPGDDGGGEGFPVGVGVGVRRALDGLGGDRERQRCPPRYGDEVVVELGGGVDGVEDLLGGAPAGGRPLLEQAEGVAVPVCEVA